MSSNEPIRIHIARETDSARLSVLLQPAVEALLRHRLVVIPTETVYGLAANAVSSLAMDRLREAKQRPPNKPFPVQAPNMEAVRRWEVELPPEAVALGRAHWPGPLTLVLPHVRPGETSVGVRVPDHPVAAALLRLIGAPLAAPSANRSGEPPCLTAGQAAALDLPHVAVIVDGGPAAHGAPSTVVDCTVSPPVVLRQGALDLQTLRRTTPELVAEHGETDR